MRHQRFFHICVCLALAVSSVYGGDLNTDCNVNDDALQVDLGADQSALVPKVCFDVEDTERCFYLLQPDCARDHSSVTMVVDLHDSGACPLEQSRISGWKEYALSECFVVAWPLGVTDAGIADEPCFTVPGGIPVTDSDGAPWGVAPDCCCEKDGKYVAESTTNDVLFLHQMISRAIDEAGLNNIVVNTTTVKFTGYGNGATAAMGFTAIHSDVVACLAPFSGPLVTQFAADYSAVAVFSVMDTENTQLKDDAVVAAENVVSPIGSGPHILPASSRVDGYFATANQCGVATSRSNVATDKLTKKEGIVTGGKFADCEEPVNFLRPPFAAYKARDTAQTKASIEVGNPVNRVVDTTGIALLFCKDRLSTNSAYQVPNSAAAAATMSTRFVLALSFLAMTAIAVFVS